MPSQVNAWPGLSATSGNASRHPQQRILDLNNDAGKLIGHIRVNDNIRIPQKIQEFIKVVQDITQDLLMNPLGGDWRKAIDDLRQSNIRQEQSYARIEQKLDAKPPANLSSTMPTTRTKTWAELVQGSTPSPYHCHSSQATLGSLGATPTELSEDREVIVKLSNKDTVGRFRKIKPMDIKKNAERCREGTSRPLATTRFVAARQLKSGDLSLCLRTAAEAEVVRRHTD
jgi:hypothetical protein